MKRTDEMKLGDQQRQLNNAREGFDVYAALTAPPTTEWPSDRRISKNPALGAPYGDDSTNWIELNALKWKLRIVETLALIGWCGFVLTLLGVLR